MPTDYGRFATGTEAANVLKSAGIRPETWLDPYAGEYVTYNGQKYWIGQAEYFLGVSAERTDGYHTVYALSADEVKLHESINAPDTEAADMMATLAKLAAAGIGAYVLVNVLGLFKK